MRESGLPEMRFIQHIEPGLLKLQHSFTQTGQRMDFDSKEEWDRIRERMCIQTIHCRIGKEEGRH
jgi:hypothetical protein